MDEPASGVRAHAQALDALIREAVVRAQAGKEGVESDAMLFLGNRHQSFPALMVRDPVLEPVDKLVWMAIMLTVYRSTGNTAFPGHDAIGRIANISSRSTVARAIAVLRATRWLTLCARVRSARGRFSGNVYALHDEPLGLADALHLDDGYMAFLEASLNHIHARVRAVVRAVLDSMDEDIGAGRDVLARSICFSAGSRAWRCPGRPVHRVGFLPSLQARSASSGGSPAVRRLRTSTVTKIRTR